MKKIFYVLMVMCMVLTMNIVGFAEKSVIGDFTDEQYENYINTDFYQNTVYPDTMQPRYPGATLPLAEYSVGSYFSKNGKACTHHSQGICDIYGGCPCKSYKNSIQCMGFANYVFRQFTGQDCVNSNSVGGLQNISATSLKNYISQLKAGSHVRYMGTNGIPHSFIIKAKRSNEIEVYEANYAKNNCIVGTRTITYSQLASQVRSVTNAWTN